MIGKYLGRQRYPVEVCEFHITMYVYGDAGKSFSVPVLHGRPGEDLLDHVLAVGTGVCHEKQQHANLALLTGDLRLFPQVTKGRREEKLVRVSRLGRQRRPGGKQKNQRRQKRRQP